MRAVLVPVTVKFRKGWDEAHQNAEFANVCEVAVQMQDHPRGTREQLYAGSADRGCMAEVKRAVNYPCCQRDVTSGASALETLAETGCDGVMVGGRRWETRLYLRKSNARWQDGPMKNPRRNSGGRLHCGTRAMPLSKKGRTR